MKSWMYLNSPSAQAIVLPFLLYYGFSMLIQGPLETSSSQSSMQEVATSPSALGFRYIFADPYPAA